MAVGDDLGLRELYSAATRVSSPAAAISRRSHSGAMSNPFGQVGARQAWRGGVARFMLHRGAAARELTAQVMGVSCRSEAPAWLEQISTELNRDSRIYGRQPPYSAVPACTRLRVVAITQENGFSAN
jgi:hypothetical protein